MACKGCGSTDLSEHLGRCSTCILIAFASSVACWSLWFYLERAMRIAWLSWAVGGFASLLTLLLFGHVVARLARPSEPDI